MILNEIISDLAPMILSLLAFGMVMFGLGILMAPLFFGLATRPRRTI